MPEQRRKRRRSTISTISHEVRHSITMATAIDERIHSHHSHLASTISLCSCVLTMFYLLMNCFPYSGFMAMSLVPGLTEESAGTFAGILSSSFMVGRAFSSYPWGKIAAVYGRKFVLVVSLLNSAIFSLVFGLSPTFSVAVTSRFLMGIGNGIMLIARTSISELARGDHELEARGMGLLISMVGVSHAISSQCILLCLVLFNTQLCRCLLWYRMPLAPAVGLPLSEPMTQYPNMHWFHGRFDHVLSEFPFILPNVFASILSLLSLMLVVLSIEETLPEEKRRPVRYVIPDVCRLIARLPITLWHCLEKSMASCLARENTTHEYEQVSTAMTEKDDTEDSIEEDLKILEQKDCSELTALLSSSASRASYSSAMHRPSVISLKSKETEKSATIKSLMSKKSTRDCLFSYWMNCFVNVAVNEAFPLFCMSKHGGLGLSETQIGGIGTGAGLLFCICQYFFFSYGMKKFGLQKSLVYASLLSNAPATLFPVSLLLPSGWMVLVFLSILMALIMIFNAVFYANITIVTNRTVESYHKATLNGLSTMGASLSRGASPLFAGSLVAFCLSSGVFPSQHGALFIYIVLGGLGMMAFAFTRRISADEEEERSSEEKKQDGIEIEGMTIVTEEGTE